jgi:O-antigen ligase
VAKNKNFVKSSKLSKGKEARTLPKNDVNVILLVLSFIPILYASIFQGGYFAWETYATLLLSLPAILFFAYLKFVKSELFKTGGAERPLFLLLAVTFISLFFTVYFHATLTEFYKVVLYIALFYITLNAIKKGTLIDFATNAILAISVVLATGGILAFIGYKLNLQSAFFKFLSAKGLMQGAALSSTLQYSNTFGAFLILPFFISLGGFLNATQLYQKIVYILLTLLFLITFGLTQSRGAIITFLIALVIFFAVLKKHEIKISLFYFVMISVALLVVFLIKKDLFLSMFNLLISKLKDTFLFLKGQSDQSLGGRITMIKDSLNILKAHPIFGIGNGTYQYVYAKYRSVYFFSKFPHSIFFQVLDEEGIVGGVAFIYMIGTLFAKGFKIVKARYSPLLSGLYAGVVGLSLHAFIDFDWSLMFMPMVFFFAFGIIFSQGEEAVLSFKCPIRVFFKKKGLIKDLKTKKNGLPFASKCSILIAASFIIFLLFLFPFLSANTDRLTTAKIGTVSGTEIISSYQSAISLNPLDATPHYDLAHYYTGAVMPNVQNPSNYVQNAIDQYNAAIQRCPDFFLYHYELGKLYLQIGDAKSIDEFAKGVSLNPLDPGGHASLAFAYLNLKKNTDIAQIQLDEALKLGQEAIKEGYAGKDVLADTYLGYGTLYEQLNEQDKALENYKLAIDANHNNAYAYYRMGMIYEGKSMLPEAVQDLFWSVQYNPMLKEARAEFEKYAPIITVVNPQNGMAFKPNDIVKMQWISSNFNNIESYAIYLIPAQGDWSLLASNINPKTFSYDWKIAETLPLGIYTLRIYAVAPNFMQGQLGNWISFTDVKISIQK